MLLFLSPLLQLSSGLMAWGQCCQPRLPPPAWTPLVSSSTQCCTLYRFSPCVSHRAHIFPQPWMGSTAEPKPQPIHGALGGFLWSQVSFLISQHSGWLCWPWALCRVHLGPHTSDSADPAPGLLAPLVLTTYCPPSKHSCNIPFPSVRVSRAFIW